MSTQYGINYCIIFILLYSSIKVYLNVNNDTGIAKFIFTYKKFYFDNRIFPVFISFNATIFCFVYLYYCILFIPLFVNFVTFVFFHWLSGREGLTALSCARINNAWLLSYSNYWRIFISIWILFNYCKIHFFLSHKTIMH